MSPETIETLLTPFKVGSSLLRNVGFIILGISHNFIAPRTTTAYNELKKVAVFKIKPTLKDKLSNWLIFKVRC